MVGIATDTETYIDPVGNLFLARSYFKLSSNLLAGYPELLVEEAKSLLNPTSSSADRKNC